jgi:hypothetical protein
MNVVRGALRLLVLVLSFGISVGSALDACLVSCHPGTVKQNATTGHCHTVPGSDHRSHLQAVPRCCHDGSSGLANRTDDGRTKLIGSSSLAMTSVAVDGRVNLPTKPFSFDQALAIRSSSNRCSPPLRV